jgi:hypothetical protein
MFELIKLMGNIAFDKMIERTAEGKAKFDAMSPTGQDLFRKTYQMGYVDGSVEALAMTQGINPDGRDAEYISDPIEPFKVDVKADRLSYDEWTSKVDPRNANPDDGTGE